MSAEPVAEGIASIAAAPNTFSAEYVKRLEEDLRATKETAAAAQVTIGGLQAKVARAVESDRAYLKKTEADVGSTFDTLLEENPDHADTLKNWKKMQADYSNTEDLVPNMEITKLITCCSNSLKRRVELASVAASKDDALKAKCEENDKICDELRETKKQKAELEHLIQNIHSQNEDLVQRVVKAEGVSTKYDFSQKSRREGEVEPVKAEVPVGAPSVSSLQQFISDYSTAPNSNWVKAPPSHHLGGGASAPSASTDISSMIRGYARP